MRLFETHVTIAADNVEQVRRCDVQRLVETSQSVRGIDPQRFADWLMKKRPDLTATVCECLKEIGQ
jgi:hypothetical protein